MIHNNRYDYNSRLQRTRRYNHPFNSYAQTNDSIKAVSSDNQSRLSEIDFNDLYEYALENDPKLIQMIGGNKDEFIKTFEVYLDHLPEEHIDALKFFNKQLDWSTTVLTQVQQEQVKLDQVIEQLKNRPANARQDAYNQILEDYQATNNLQYGITLNLENKKNTDFVKDYLKEAKNFTKLAALFLPLGIGAIKAAGLLTITSTTILGALATPLVLFGFGYLLYYLNNVGDKLEKKIADTENKVSTIEQKNIEQKAILDQLYQSDATLPAPITPVPKIPVIPEEPAKPITPGLPKTVIASTTVTGNYPSESSFFVYFSFVIYLDLYNNGIIQDSLKVSFFNINNWKQFSLTIKLGPIEIKPSDPGYSRVYIASSFSWEGIHIYDRPSSGELKNLRSTIRYKDSDLNEGAEVRLAHETFQYTIP
ncbi:MAG: hypothetical protein PHF63_02200 [Herbinix sp.]|nr:hypothetical protein [Herbinix sp.]